MGWRYRKRLPLFKGIWLNASKSGVSASVRVAKGATVNFKPGRGLRVTESIPGTGISWSQDLSTHRRRTIQRATIGSAKPRKRRYWWLVLAAFFVLWGALAHHGSPVAAPTSPAVSVSPAPEGKSGRPASTSPAPNVTHELHLRSAPKALPMVPGELPNRNPTPGETFETITIQDLKAPGLLEARSARHC